MSAMLTVGEQQELRRIEQELRDTDRGFAWRLILFQGILRWARPDSRAYLPALAALAAALLCLVAVARRPLVALAERAMRIGREAVMVLGDTAWPGWDPGPVSGRGAGLPPERTQSDGMDPA